MLLGAVTHMPLQAVAGKLQSQSANQPIPTFLGKNTGRCNRWGQGITTHHRLLRTGPETQRQVAIH